MQSTWHYDKISFYHKIKVFTSVTILPVFVWTGLGREWCPRATSGLTHTTSKWASASVLNIAMNTDTLHMLHVFMQTQNCWTFHSWLLRNNEVRYKCFTYTNSTSHSYILSLSLILVRILSLPLHNIDESFPFLLHIICCDNCTPVCFTKVSPHLFKIWLKSFTFIIFTSTFLSFCVCVCVWIFI